MGYVIAAIVLLLLVAGFVTFLVLNSMRKGSAKAEEGGQSGSPGVGQDATPLGDTTEHAGTHAETGETAEDPEGGEDPSRPARPEDRQLRDAGARE
jgi:hypothetical protein